MTRPLTCPTDGSDSPARQEGVIGRCCSCEAGVMAHDPVDFVDLPAADLVVDRTYRGGINGNYGDDPIFRLLPVGNQGGFRVAGSIVKGTVRLIVLYTSGTEVDWPDEIDPTTGDFTYYGDNRSPGRELHDTPRGGNLLLRDVFAASRASADRRLRVPPPSCCFRPPGTAATSDSEGCSPRVRLACRATRSWWRSGEPPRSTDSRTIALTLPFSGRQS